MTLLDDLREGYEHLQVHELPTVNEIQVLVGALVKHLDPDTELVPADESEAVTTDTTATDPAADPATSPATTNPEGNA